MKLVSRRAKRLGWQLQLWRAEQKSEAFEPV